uniref:Photosystem II reaction center protein Z n=1 Tax=Olisthodiscus luteus TaxID=83000 RepID=A0A7U0QG26_OLILU|nr:photosystem II protein Z [Olisthodiscus luteus]QQW50561.1 photosystem II protein Z [Olisthodiscus luteus]
MITVLQLLTGFLVILSLGLIVIVPVAFALPNEWEKSKGLVYGLARLWTGVVFITGCANSFA